MEEDLIALLCPSNGDIVTSPFMPRVHGQSSGGPCLATPSKRGDLGLSRGAVFRLATRLVVVGLRQRLEDWHGPGRFLDLRYQAIDD